MNLETWFAYLTAYLVLSVIPGPSVFMVLGQSLSRGFSAALFCILGDLLGGVVVMTASYIGVGMVLATSSQAFFVLKWAGAAYMAWLGIHQILASRRMGKVDICGTTAKSPRSTSLKAGFVTGILNPKAILFYVAFLAQFLDSTQPVLPQFLILMTTSMAVVFVVLTGYAVLASQAFKTMRSLRARKRIGYVGGSFLLGGSVLIATNR